MAHWPCPRQWPGWRRFPSAAVSHRAPPHRHAACPHRARQRYAAEGVPGTHDHPRPRRAEASRPAVSPCGDPRIRPGIPHRCPRRPRAREGAWRRTRAVNADFRFACAAKMKLDAGYSDAKATTKPIKFSSVAMQRLRFGTKAPGYRFHPLSDLSVRQVTMQDRAPLTLDASLLGDRHGRRIVIEEIYPSIDAGRFPIKRIAGEPVDVWADIFRDGHAVLAAALLWRPQISNEWSCIAMRLD